MHRTLGPPSTARVAIVNRQPAANQHNHTTREKKRVPRSHMLHTHQKKHEIDTRCMLVLRAAPQL
jgi:hypothetical protein